MNRQYIRRLRALIAPIPGGRLLRFGLVVALGFSLAGCSYFIERQTSHAARQLSETILDHEDPATVSAAIPTLLIVMDSYARGDRSSGQAKMTAARLYGAYAGAFVDDSERRKILTTTAFRYAVTGACKLDFDWCGIQRLDSKAFTEFVTTLEPREVETAYAYAVAWLNLIQAHSDDWSLVAELPGPQQLFEFVLGHDEGYDHAGAHLYLGALALMLPPALGGKPELGRQHFDRAIELTDGRNLVIKLEYARRYARMMFDRALHHRLLSEVVAADPAAEGLTLMNVWAQQQARLLLEQEPEYFD